MLVDPGDDRVNRPGNSRIPILCRHFQPKHLWRLTKKISRKVFQIFHPAIPLEVQKKQVGTITMKFSPAKTISVILQGVPSTKAINLWKGSYQPLEELKKLEVFPFFRWCQFLTL